MLCLIAACSDPRATLIPSDMATWDKSLAPTIEKLTPEEKKLFAAWVVRTKLSESFGGEPMPVGVTVAQALEQQKKWADERQAKEAEERALKEKLLAEQAAIAKQIDDTVTVTVLNLELEKEGFVQRQAIKIGLKNKGDKDIKGVSGSIKFIDIFDKKVGEMTFGYDKGLKAGSETSWSGVRDYNQFIAEHKAIANLQSGKYTTKFEPEMIVFEDGTKLAVKK